MAIKSSISSVLKKPRKFTGDPENHGPANNPHQNYPSQKQGFNKALLRDNGG